MARLLHVHEGNIRYRRIEAGLYEVQRAKRAPHSERVEKWRVMGRVQRRGDKGWAFQPEGHTDWFVGHESKAEAADNLMSYDSPTAAWLI